MGKPSVKGWKKGQVTEEEEIEGVTGKSVGGTMVWSKTSPPQQTFLVSTHDP